jgi:hypothetical protein
MNFARDINSLRRYIVLSQFVSLLVFLFGLVSIILFVDPSLVNVPDHQTKLYRGHWLWLLTGILFIALSTACIFIAARWSRRLIWIYRNAKPQSMKLSIEIDSDSDGTNYYAILSGESEETERWKVLLYSPKWDVRILPEQAAAKVYFDPQSQRPAVVETDYGLLWSMAGGGAAEFSIVSRASTRERNQF